MKGLKYIPLSILFVGAFGVFIWVLDIIFDHLGILEERYQPLIYIIPIFVAFGLLIHLKTKK